MIEETMRHYYTIILCEFFLFIAEDFFRGKCDFLHGLKELCLTHLI